MRVLIVALDFKPNPGGIAEYTYQLARQLDCKNHNVVVLTKHSVLAQCKPISSEAFSGLIIRHYNQRVLKAQGARGLWGRYKLIREMAENASAELIISNTIQSESVICWIIAKQMQIPFCTMAYGREVNSQRNLSSKSLRSRIRMNVVEELVLKRADRVFCISRYTHDTVSSMGVKHEKLALLPPGISIKDMKSTVSELPDSLLNRLDYIDRKIVLTVARLVERKGIDTSLHAIALVRRLIPDILYVVVGDGPDRSRLEQLIQGLGISENVVFLGHLSEPEKKSCYELADIFIMPNRELDDGDVEGFGIVFLEANFFGKPVIAGNSGGAKDAVIDGVTGLLVDPLQPEEIAASIMLLLKNPQYARQIGQRGKQRVEKEFNWDRIGTKFIVELEKLVAV